jgi:hypothetical protein
MPSLRERQLVDDALLAYVEWREECAAVWESDSRWGRTAPEDAERAHAVYLAALDREEAAAKAYATLLERIGELLQTGAMAAARARRNPTGTLTRKARRG